MVVGNLDRPLASKLCSHNAKPSAVVGLTLWEQSLLAIQAPRCVRQGPSRARPSATPVAPTGMCVIMKVGV